MSNTKSNTEIEIVTDAQVRAWAVRKGLCSGVRGRLPLSTIEAYNKAHKVRRYDLSAARVAEIERRRSTRELVSA